MRVFFFKIKAQKLTQMHLYKRKCNDWLFYCMSFLFNINHL